MNLSLKRRNYRPDGIFSALYDDSGKLIAVTLEHAYCTDLYYEPKIPAGTFLCVRGTHSLHNGIPFETFEVTGVPGHTGLLFHAGNFDADSEGCILVGEAIAQKGSAEMITNSRATLDKFLALQSGINQFTLTVSD